MEQMAQVIQLNTPGPNGGVSLAIVDFSTKKISYVEITPTRPNKITVWEVQDDYGKRAG
jgi:hypothetical protein